MPQYRVLAQPRVLRADVNRVVGPIGDPYDGQPSGVADDEFDVVGVCSAAPVVDDHDHLAELLDPDLQMPVGDRTLARPGDVDVDRLSGLNVSPDGDQRRGVERRKCLGRNPIGGNATLTQPLVAAAHGLHLHAGLFADGDLGVAGGTRRAVVQAAQPPQRGEPPDLVAAVRDLEGVDVKGSEQLPLIDSGVVGGDRHPTEPSICNSISRLSSSAYSMGSSLAIGSTKPRTTIAIASSSVSPRLIR